MKKLLFASILILSAWKIHAAPLVTESPVISPGTPVTVSISTSTQTKVPTSQTSGRTGIFIDNPSTNTAVVVGFLGDCTSTALASTIRPIEISPSSNTAFIPMREDVCLWLISLHSSAESVHYQEAKQ